MRCPRCGGRAEAIGNIGQFRRYQCMDRDCFHTFTEQIADHPPHVPVYPDQLPERRDQ